jgi:hypothetical protein
MLSGPARLLMAAAKALTLSCDMRSSEGPHSTLLPGHFLLRGAGRAARAGGGGRAPAVVGWACSDHRGQGAAHAVPSLHMLCSTRAPVSCAALATTVVQAAAQQSHQRRHHADASTATHMMSFASFCPASTFRTPRMTSAPCSAGQVSTAAAVNHAGSAGPCVHASNHCRTRTAAGHAGRCRQGWLLG